MYKIADTVSGKPCTERFLTFLARFFQSRLLQFCCCMVERVTLSLSLQAQMDEFLRTHKRDGGHGYQTDNDDVPIGLEMECFPPLGSRIRRKQVLSTQLYGTVTKHFNDG